MKKTACILLLSLAACSGIHTRDRNGSFDLADHFNEICGFPLPATLSILHESDNGEGRAEALYTVDKAELKLFIQKNNFVPLDTFLLPYTSGLLREGKAELLARYDLQMNHDEKYKLKSHTGLLAFESCRNKNRFTLMADTSESILWLKNEYPDMAGDAPACE